VELAGRTARAGRRIEGVRDEGVDECTEARNGGDEIRIRLPADHQALDDRKMGPMTFELREFLGADVAMQLHE
jgi:hypothetical protein